MLLMCVCRQVDVADFDPGVGLCARIQQDDFQCGLCQMQVCFEAGERSDPFDSGKEIDTKSSQRASVDPK
jgi:hypothetical protein